MIGVVVSLVWLYLQVQIAVKALWQDKLICLLLWLVAFCIAILRIDSGHLTIEDVINSLLLGIILVPFLQ